MGSQRSLRRNALPSYLYLKNGTYYYRYAIPKGHNPDLRRREVRVSLRTGYRSQAHRFACRLHAALLDFMEFHPMPQNDTPDAQSRGLEDLREHLQKRLDDLLMEPGKRPVPAVSSSFQKDYNDISQSENKPQKTLLLSELIDKYSNAQI